MKLAKQIITLSAVALCAMGLSFILISGIVIGAQASTGAEYKSLEITYTEQKRELTEANNKLIDAAKETLAEKEAATTGTEAEIAAAIKTAKENVTKAEKNKKDVLRKFKNLYEQNRIVINKGGYLQNATIAAATGTFTTTTSSTMTMGWRARVQIAFMEISSTVETNLTASGSSETVNEGLRLTPMGTLMVLGISFTFIGGALVVTVIVMNKNQAGKKEAKKAA